jgi:hypothetical protein
VHFVAQPTSTPCPHCGQSVYVLATICWHCKQPLRFNPPLERGSREAVRVIQGWQQPPLQSAEQSLTEEVAADKEEEGLSPVEAAVHDFLLKLGKKNERATGKQIVAELKRKHIHLSESTLRRHILPRLMRISGVRNDRDKRGYYVP